MNYFGDRFRRYSLVLLLCLVGLGVTTGMLVYAQSGGGDAIVYLPAVSSPVGSSHEDTLQNGGTVMGPDGVGIGALTDTLEAPITVSISRAAAPAHALPSRAQAVGDYYEIGADGDVFVATEEPFILAFPVAPGANVDHLALAVLTPSEDADDAAGGLWAWTFLEGLYDVDRNLFLTTIAGLAGEGQTFILVTHPDFDSPPNQAALDNSRPANPQVEIFTAKCIHFDNPADCTTATENTVADMLNDLYERLQQELAFNDPRLRRLDIAINFTPNWLSFLGYTVYIEPSSYGFCAGPPAAGGYYSPSRGRLVLCLNPAVGLDPSYVHVLIHEYFHATQSGYQPVLDDYWSGVDDKWIKEGMAKSVEESYFVNEMLRSETSGWEQLHKVDRPLDSTDENDEYHTQDFWVFYGQKNGLYLPYFQDILNQGARTEDVVSVLGDGNFLPAYWEWAKNQVMEKEINFGGVLQSPCFVEEQVVEQYEIFEHHWTDKLYHQLTVGPLTTAVVELTFNEVYDHAYGWVYGSNQDQMPDAEMALEYKFYEDGESGCEAVPDGPREWPDGEGVMPGKTYYVVISNTDYDAAYDYTITFELAFPD